MSIISGTITNPASLSLSLDSCHSNEEFWGSWVDQPVERQILCLPETTKSPTCLCHEKIVKIHLSGRTPSRRFLRYFILGASSPDTDCYYRHPLSQARDFLRSLLAC